MSKLSEWLEERKSIADMPCASPEDGAYYKGALRAVEFDVVVTSNNIAEWLDETWSVAEAYGKSTHKAYYSGAIKAPELRGYTCERDDSGKHKVYN